MIEPANNAQRIWKSLAANRVDKIAFLPCNKLNGLMREVPDSIDVWNITKESAGLGLCFGRSLAGKRSAMMIQNTGLGNLVTELYTLQKLYQEALPIFVSWRGYYKEPIEAQVIFGGKVEDLLKAIDVEYVIVKSSADLVNLDRDIASCFNENKIKVFLLSPELWEVNTADYHVFGEPRIKPVALDVDGYDGTPVRKAFDTFADPPEFELYDLENDAVEFNNLAGKRQYRAVQERLTKALFEYRKQTDDPFLDPSFVKKIDQRGRS